MIIQLGSIFGSLISNIGSGLSGIVRQLAPAALDLGQQFLQREINRKLGTSQRRVIQGAAVQVLNTPGISVARLGGTVQSVGGSVQRATFTPAAFTPAQSPIGNIPLLPVGISGFPVPRLGARLPGGMGFGFGFPQPSVFPENGGKKVPNPVTGFAGARRPGAPGEPRFAQDEFGKTIMFVPLPDGRGFVPVAQARALNLNPTRPFWRFNRLTSNYEKIKPRRLNPFNFRATARAGRRVCRTLDAVKELVHIERRQTTGKIRLKKVKKRKSCK